MTETAYLDWNGAAPLCEEAKRAMIAAMDVVGNPSSVHSGGRQAKALIDEAREDIAALVDCEPGEVIFTSGATEASNWVIRDSRWTSLFVPSIEHDAVLAAAQRAGVNRLTLATSSDGTVDLPSLRQFMSAKADSQPLVCIQAANSETGVVQDVRAIVDASSSYDARIFTDACQMAGREDDTGRRFSFAASGAHYAAIASEKFGGPAGVGAMIQKTGYELKPFIVGGGQEMRLRSGTENLLGIVGMGAAARAVSEGDSAARIHEMSTYIRSMLATVADDAREFGADAPRVVNTTCVAVPGWKASTQMMQLDLQGVAVSAGAACSSGKVSESKVLRAMGNDRFISSSAIRVSIGRTTTEDEIARFIDVWGALYRDRAAKARTDLIDLDTDRLKGTTNG